ncbi:endonuclease III [Candidatus Woesearchaeota archaeon]|nr:endonuclease III [Candidatus Woesearchaeota archaeon]
MKDIPIIIGLIKESCKDFKNPIVTEIGDQTGNPFKVLVSCLLSLRTKDEVTGKVCKELFSIAQTPEEILKIPLDKFEKIIYKTGFYKTKARNIRNICKILIQDYNSKVPNEEEELLKFKGVGRKTMNIVMTYGFKSNDNIAVDIHVHRIPNRIGWVKTKTPEQTEVELKKVVPKTNWQDINNIFVTFGQNICKPISPLCSKCSINKYCKKVNVKKSR